MKKITTTIFALLMTVMVIGQTRSLQSVSYRGAFEPGVTAWTSGWTEFSPNSPAYTTSKLGSTAVAVTRAITANTTWTNNKIYTITGPIYVKSGATLTIQPGTIIKGNSTVSNSSLIIQRGAKLIAQGTATDPIIFTSDKTTGNRNIGDWGGVILLGNAKINPAGGVTNIEGLAPSLDNQYGGNDDDDNSGIMTYCRIEFAGYIFAPDKEINGLTFGGVGRKTTIHHIQVSYANDDSYEWFGGTVNATNLVAYRGLDDDFDTDFGYSGTLQFCLGIRDKNISDQSSNSNSEGLESDNEAIGTDATITPKTKSVFSNFTIIGPYRGDNNFDETVSTGSFKFKRAMRIRRNSNLRVFNSVFTDFQNGIFIDGQLCVKNAVSSASDANSLAVKSNIFANMKNGATIESDSRWGTTFLGVTAPSSATWFTANNNSYQASSNGLFTSTISSSNIATADYTPAVGSDLRSGADFTTDFIAERTSLELTTPVINQGENLEIANLSASQTATITVNAVNNADSYIWSTDAKSGVTFVSGQGTNSVDVTFATNLVSTSLKPLYIYVQAKNNSSSILSGFDKIFIQRTKPTFTIGALTSNPNNNLIAGAAQVTVSSASASGQKVITVSSTTGLQVGMFVKVEPGTTSGNVGTNNYITAVNTSTTFTVANNITTTLQVGGKLNAFFVPQGTFGTTSALTSAASYTSVAGATNLLNVVTVVSTTGLVEGMWLRIVSGTGVLNAGTVVSKIIDGTQFEMSAKPKTDLGSNAVIAAYPLMTNICPVAATTGSSSEFDYTVVSTTVANNIGFKFDVPAGARICRVGSNSIPTYTSAPIKTITTTANSIGVVFDAAYTTGSVSVTPYNNAGLGTKFAVTVAKVKPTLNKVTSSAAAVQGTTVTYTANVNFPASIGSYKWTIPANSSSTSGTTSGSTVTTTTPTLVLAFTSSFTTGNLGLELVSACGLATSTLKNYTLNATKTLTKTSGEIELQEITEEVTNATSFNLFPNPNNGNFNINMTTKNTEEVAQVTIINVLGQVVSSIAIPNNNGVINSEVNANLSTGIYFVRVQLGSEVNIAKISVN